MKNTLEGINSRLDEVEDPISDLEDNSKYQAKHQKESIKKHQKGRKHQKEKSKEPLGQHQA